MTSLIKTITRSKGRIISRRAGLLAALVLAGASFSLAAADRNKRVSVNKTSFIEVTDRVTGVTVGNPEVADVNILDPNHLYILGKRLGSTNVTLLCGKGPCGSNPTIQIEVTHDLDGLKAKLHELFPGEAPKVLSSQGSIVLSGQVSSLQKMDAIYKIAQTFISQGEQPSSPIRRTGALR